MRDRIGGKAKRCVFSSCVRAKRREVQSAKTGDYKLKAGVRLSSYKHSINAACQCTVLLIAEQTCYVNVCLPLPASRARSLPVC